MDTTAIKKAVTIKGGQSKLANDLGVSPQMVWQWVNDLRPVPAKYAIKIEQVTKSAVSRHDLCPDVFGPAPTKKRAA